MVVSKWDGENPDLGSNMVIFDDKVSQCFSHFLDWTQLSMPIWYVTKRIFHKTMSTLQM